MTLVEITFELQSHLTAEQLRGLSEFANTYGLRRFRLNETKSLIAPAPDPGSRRAGWREYRHQARRPATWQRNHSCFLSDGLGDILWIEVKRIRWESIAKKSFEAELLLLLTLALHSPFKTGARTRLQIAGKFRWRSLSSLCSGESWRRN